MRWVFYYRDLWNIIRFWYGVSGKLFMWKVFIRYRRCNEKRQMIEVNILDLYENKEK